MIGQGSPTSERGRPAPMASWLAAGLRSALAAVLLCAAALPAAAETPLRVRIEWGGGEPRLWQGTIALERGRFSAISPLGIEADEPGSMWIEAGQVHIQPRSPRAYDGADLDLDADPEAKLLVSLTAAGSDPAGTFEVAVADLVQSTRNLPLDQAGNRLLVRRTPGDLLRVKFERESLVFAPGETFSFIVQPQQLTEILGGTARVRVELAASRSGRPIWTDDFDLFVSAGVKVASDWKVPVELPLPEAEGAYDVNISVRERGLRTRIVPVVPGKTLLQRTVQLVVVSQKASIPRETAGWKKVVEIDPANPSWWKRMVRLPHLTRLPTWPQGPWGSGEIQPLKHPLGDMMRMPQPASADNPPWQAYPLQLDRPGTPHLLEVELPSDVQQHLGISIVEPNAAGAVMPVGVDSGVYVPEDTSREPPKMLRHKVLFWPRTKSPLVVLTQGDGSGAAVFSKIRVFARSEVPRAPPLPATTGRLMAGYFDRPLFSKNFSATGVLDSWSGQEIDDWETFLQAGNRLIDYLHFAGYNGAMIAVLADGSTIYPSRYLQPTPRYDTGLLGTAGRDPLRKDALELLLRMFDREGLRLVPALEFAAPLPELEELRRRGHPHSLGLELVGADGSTWIEKYPPQRALAPYYNPLHPRVQQAMLDVARELVERYAEHRSFEGLALQLTGEGYALLPGPEWGLDDDTVGRFERDTGIQVPAGPGPERFHQRAGYLLGEGRESWLKWRAERMTDFYRQLQQVLLSERPDARLLLAGAGLLEGPSARRRLRPSLPQNARLERWLYEMGVDAERLSESQHIVLLRPQRVSPPGSVAGRALDVQVNTSTDLDRRLAAAAARGALLYHPPQRLRLQSFDEQNPLEAASSYTMLVSQPVPAGRFNRRRIVQSLAALDAGLIFDGGWLLPLGQEDATRRIVAIYRQLPVDGFQTSSAGRQPVVVRTRNADKDTYIYAVNPSPWPVQAVLHLQAAADCTMTELESARPERTITGGSSPHAWTVALGPYDLAAVRLSDPNVRIAGAAIELADEVKIELDRRIDELGTRAAALANQPPLDVLQNPGFEEHSAGGEVLGWSLLWPQAGGMVLDRELSRRGNCSLRLSAHRQIVSLQSNLFDVPRSGRLALSVWLRTDDLGQQPRLRLAIEGPDNGRTYYRFAQVGGNRPPEVPLTDQWTQYLFQVDDLPADALEQVRVRFDLMSAGNVWIDDVELHALKFNKNERIELSKILASARGALGEGEVVDCLRMLESYWPQFLKEQVPLETGSLARELPTPLPPPTEEPAAPGTLDRLRGYIPKFMRF